MTMVMAGSMVSITFTVPLVLVMVDFMTHGVMVDLEDSVDLDLVLADLDSVMVAMVMATEDMDLDLTTLDLEDFTGLTDMADSSIEIEDLVLEGKTLPLTAEDVVFTTIEMLLPEDVPQGRALHAEVDDLT